MQLPSNLSELSDTWAKAPQDKIAKSISLVAIIVLAYLLAQFTWLVLTPTQSPVTLAAKPVTSTGQQNNQSANVAGITALNLFGKYNQEPKVEEVVVQDAPETSLRLTLSGTVASDDPATAAAIIENNGKQETYGIGDQITGTRATLESVATDRVIIKHRGKHETLMLDGVKYSKQKAKRQSARTTSREKTKTPPTERRLVPGVADVKAELAANPAKLTDYMRISPRRVEGKITGYELRPGKRPEFFTAAGLKAGDVAVQINGLDLTVPQESMQALRALREDSDLSLLIDRGGEMTEILLSLDSTK